MGDYKYFQLKCWLETLSVKLLYEQAKKGKGLEKIVLVFNGEICNVGLADRLRSISSVYYWCKKNKIAFNISFSKPFRLSDFLVPNIFDWTVSDRTLNYSNSNPRALISYNWIFGEERNISLHRRYLDKLKKTKYSQIHLYTNTYCYDEFFYDGFRDLFKPSVQLETELERFKNDIGCDYVSISFRFTQLLGDLKDTHGEALNEDERECLISVCKKSILPILKTNGVNKCLVTSDSKTFLKEVSKLSYVYLLPGEVGHICNDVTEEQVRKTFWDMFMISRAKKAYMVRTEQMYRSGFAKRAAMIGNIPFEEIILK